MFITNIDNIVEGIKRFNEYREKLWTELGVVLMVTVGSSVLLWLILIGLEDVNICGLKRKLVGGGNDNLL